jgi:hypothetical protein
MIPEFEGYQTGVGATLRCPSCKGICIHHRTVEVFECGEDATHGLHVVVENGEAKIDTALQGNPSSRRHGLKINFWCETCSASSVLTIAQHKGSTDVNFLAA